MPVGYSYEILKKKRKTQAEKRETVISTCNSTAISRLCTDYGAFQHMNALLAS